MKLPPVTQILEHKKVEHEKESQLPIRPAVKTKIKQPSDGILRINTITEEREGNLLYVEQLKCKRNYNTPQ